MVEKSQFDPTIRAFPTTKNIYKIYLQQLETTRLHGDENEINSGISANCNAECPINFV